MTNKNLYFSIENKSLQLIETKLNQKVKLYTCLYKNRRLPLHKIEVALL